MPAEFLISRCYDVGSVGIIVAGSISSGLLREGTIGRNFKGKKGMLVRIEKDGAQVPHAAEKDKVNIFIKYLTRADVKPGEVLHFD